MQHRRAANPLSAVAILAAVIIFVSALTGGSSASDGRREAAAASRTERGLEMKCTCTPCGYPCNYRSPPPPPPPSVPHFPPRRFCPPPPPMTPSTSTWPPYYWLGSPGNLYPVEPGYFQSGARRLRWTWPAIVAMWAVVGVLVS